MRTPRVPARRLRRDGVEIRAVPGTSHWQYYVTARADVNGPRLKPAEEIFPELAAVLAEYGIRPIQERIHGLASARGGHLEIREKAFRARGLDPSSPLSHIEGRPAAGGTLGGVQIWGVGPGSAARPPEVATVDCPGRVRGRLWSGGGFRLLYIPSITGCADDGSPEAAAPAQAERMFLNARAALGAHGFSYAQVARTWIYMRRLLEWYGDFNKVRNALYRDPEFFGAPAACAVPEARPGRSPSGLGRAPAGGAFPASTGIQGRLGEEECVMNLLAVDAGTDADVRVRPILRTPRQGEPFAYRSAFSRAMALRIGGVETIYVSGTASINGAGESVYPGDREGQTLQTILSVASLLEEQGGGLENICTATLYCADPEAFEAYRRMTRLLRLPDFPTIAVLADVCRPELRLELEATALVPAAGR